MKTEAMKNQNARILHNLGVEFLVDEVGYRPTGRYLYSPSGKMCVARVQNRMGDTFTFEVTASPDLKNVLDNYTIIFVNYDETGIVEAFECLDNMAYEMEMVGADRIVLKFDSTKTKSIYRKADLTLWEKFRSHSNARRHNLESTNYSRA